MTKTVRERNLSTSDQVTTVLSYGALLLLGYLVFEITSPFLVPLAWSAVLAIFFYPLHEKVLTKLKPTPAATASALGVTFLLIVPALLVLFLTTKQAVEAGARAQVVLQDPDKALPTHALEWLKNQLPDSMQDVDLSDPVKRGAERLAGYLAGKLGGLVRNLFTFFLDLFVLIFALFFMFRDGGEVVRAVRHLMPAANSTRPRANQPYVISVPTCETTTSPLAVSTRPRGARRLKPTLCAMRGALRASGIMTSGSGRSATAAPSGERPTTNCRYWITTKNSPKLAKNWAVTVRVPALNARLPNSRGSSIGWSTRSSQPTKAASARTPSASPATVCASPHP